MRKREFICLSILLHLCSTHGDKYNMTTDALKKLFDESRYDRRIRPFFQTDKINVTVGMSVVNFGQIREVFMDFSLDIFFYQQWYDERLKHDLRYPITLGGEYRRLIWMPDTFFLNVKTAKFHNVPADNSKISIFPDGRTRYSTRLTITAGCEMNLKDYPLDEQSCNLTILSYAFMAHELDYNWDGKASKAIIVINKAMNEFDLSGFETSKEIYPYVTGRWTHLTATFSFSRRLGYSLIQVYAPTLLIVMLSWLSFWISQDAVPARVALGVTTVLTIVTLMGSFRSQVPKVSYIKAIDLFFIVSFIFVFGAVLEYVVVLLCTAVREQKRKAKNNDDNRNTSEEIMLDVLDKNQENDQQRDDIETVFSKKGFRHRIARGSKIDKTRKLVRFAFIEQNASKVDKVSRYMFPLAYTFFNIAYWMYYSFGTFKSSGSMKHSKQ
ncbi:glycine receptor subunit alpha-3-like [Actinia tenebrosa]|uniref:Gamma-aminobutyric acid receptor subunit beta n=1 Tax=Actinia tenebrosa TaxID=6105 RepID=A0A6P8I154_ACTTE|nr:glycine receptor subunit alpha-3-like [Actinia tenebrosa]